MLRRKNKFDKRSQEFLKIYQESREQQHLFIYSACGRSSTTALQRILNSSNEITIWGESWGLLDTLAHSVIATKNRKTADWLARKPQDFEKLTQSFKNNKHDQFYANAYRDIDSIINLLLSVISYTLAPISKTNRFGFKDIYLKNEKTLELLSESFPQAQFIFLFRHPISQFDSCKRTGYFNYSQDVEHYLREHSRMVKIYLTFAQKYPKRSIFFENSNLFKLESLNTLLDRLNISGFDESLLGSKKQAIDSTISSREKSTIEASGVLDLYNSMRELALK